MGTGESRANEYLETSTQDIKSANMHFSFTSALVAVLSLTTAGLAAPAELSERQSTVKIMPLGDSITGSPVC